MARIKRKVHLSELQLAILRVLWKRGEASTADVVADLGARRGLAPTTLATLLTRLAKRGVLGQRRDGRTLVYRALVSEPDVQRSMVSDLVANVFKGDATELLAHLLREEEVAPGDLAKVRARLKEGDRG
jgi:BlaI family transcriptional regulator, penicillinase repressor